MLPDDCRSFVNFVREHDPVVITPWYSPHTADIEGVLNPWERAEHYCLWNQAILPVLKRQVTGRYFNMDGSLPVIEFSYGMTVPQSWNGQPALLQGRIWASFEATDKSFERWYNALVRWIRKHFVRDPGIGHNRDSMGPSAYQWFRDGGVLLPGFVPQATEAWLKWVDVQNQYRETLKRRS